MTVRGLVLLAAGLAGAEVAMGQTVPEAEPMAPPAIEHTPVRCVGAKSFPVIEATLTPSTSFGTVYFATKERAGWYGVRLAEDGDRRKATLPRPRSTQSFRYYVEAVGEDLQTARTPEYSVSVVGRQDGCDAGTSRWVQKASKLIVEPPTAPRPGPGRASTLPPVPPGFSARGTVGEVGQFEISTPVAIIAGTGLAAAGLGLAVARDKPSDPLPPTPFQSGPGIELVGSVPPSGTPLSLTTGSLTLQLRLFSPQLQRGVQVTAALHAGVEAPCVVLPPATADLEAGRSVIVTISGPTRRAGPGCADLGGVRPPLQELRVSVREGLIFLFGTGGGAGNPHIAVSYPVTE